MKPITIILMFLLSGGGQFGMGPGPGLGSGITCTSIAPNAVTESANLEEWASADCYTNSSGCTTPTDGTTLATAWFDQATGGTTFSPNGTCVFHTNQINGKPAITFNGSTCYFSWTTGVTFGGNNTVFVVWKNASSAAKAELIGANNGGFAYWTCNSGTTQQGVDKQNIAALGSGTAACDTNWHQGNVKITTPGSGGTIAFRLNEATDTASGSPGSNTFSANTNAIGRDNGTANEFFNGQMAEFIHYNVIIGTTSLNGVECYLLKKYGI